LLNVEMAHDRFSGMNVEAGDEVHVCPRDARVFVEMPEYCI
jgi:hypothetical protein